MNPSPSKPSIRHFGGLAAYLCCAPILAAADQQAIPMNSAPTAAQLGHVFVSTCAPTLPPLMETQFELFDTAFGWEARATDADLAFSPANSELTASFDSNWEGATCTLTIPTSISGDGADLYEGLEAHLAAEIDNLPSAEFVDGGLFWTWAREGSVDVTYTVTFTETSEGHTLSTEAKQF